MTQELIPLLLLQILPQFKYPVVELDEVVSASSFGLIIT